MVEGANGTAFSLGSTGVRLAAGSVTDLGVARVSNDYGEGDAPEKLSAGKLAKMALLGPFGGSLKPKPVPAMVEFTPRSARDIPVPAELQSRVAPPTWSSSVKFGNYLGGLVNRVGGRKARPGGTAAPVAP